MKAVRTILNDHTILMYSNGTLFGAAVAGAMSFSTGLLHLDMEFDEFIKEWIERLNEYDDFERIEIID